MQATHHVRNILAALLVLIIAATLIGAVAWTPAKQAPAAVLTVKAEAPAPMVGTPTGEFDNGVPVYRLPAVSVITSRSAEMARMAREEQVAKR